MKKHRHEQELKILRLNDQLVQMKKSDGILEEDFKRVEGELNKLRKSDEIRQDELDRVKDELKKVKKNESSLADKLQSLSLAQERSRIADSYLPTPSSSSCCQSPWAGFAHSSPTVYSSSSRRSSSTYSSYECSVCGKSCASGAGLSSHMRAHSRRGQY